MMSLLKSMVAVAAFSLTVNQCAQAQVEEKHLLSGKQKIDAASGYIYLHGPARQFGIFLKTPDTADIAQYEKDWEAAFAKAKAEYVKDIAKWEKLKAATPKGQGVRPAPVEPTRESFSIGALETRNSTSFGPQYVFSKDKEKDYYSYMMAVKPGIYRYHGPIFLDPQHGYTGACFCMGSVEFEVKSGVITNVGNFLYLTMTNNRPEGRMNTSDSDAEKAAARPVDPTAKPDFSLPDSLKQFTSAVADFRAGEKTDNFYGVMVTRMPAIPGVLAYKRDKVVDLKAAPSGQ